MKEAFLSSSMKLIEQYHDPYTEEEKELLLFGLEGIYLTITKLVAIIVLSILLNMVKEVILLLIFFNILRFTGFGVHAQSSISCLITSTLFFILLPYFFLRVSIPTIVQAVLCGVCLVSYLLYAPADTVKRPLRNAKKRRIRKIGTLITGSIFTLLIFTISNPMIEEMLLTALVVQMIVILPLTYRLLGVPYHNWKQE